MKMIKKSKAIAFGMLLTLLTSPILASTSAKADFVIKAKSSVMTATDQSGVYNLSLQGVKAYYLVNRPDRSPGEVSIKSFMHTWNTGKDSFESDNPNASLDSNSELLTPIFVVLSKPNYDAKTDTLLFVTTALDQSAVDKVMQGKKSIAFKDGVSLNVDDIDLSPGKDGF